MRTKANINFLLLNENIAYALYEVCKLYVSIALTVVKSIQNTCLLNANW